MKKLQRVDKRRVKSRRDERRSVGDQMSKGEETTDEES